LFLSDHGDRRRVKKGDKKWIYASKNQRRAWRGKKPQREMLDTHVSVTRLFMKEQSL
jgi:hypothetical protein